MEKVSDAICRDSSSRTAEKNRCSAFTGLTKTHPITFYEFTNFFSQIVSLKIIPDIFFP